MSARYRRFAPSSTTTKKSRSECSSRRSRSAPTDPSPSSAGHRHDPRGSGRGRRVGRATGGGYRWSRVASRGEQLHDVRGNVVERPFRVGRACRCSRPVTSDRDPARRVAARRGEHDEAVEGVLTVADHARRADIVHDDQGGTDDLLRVGGSREGDRLRTCTLADPATVDNRQARPTTPRRARRMLLPVWRSAGASPLARRTRRLARRWPTSVVRSSPYTGIGIAWGGSVGVPPSARRGRSSRSRLLAYPAIVSPSPPRTLNEVGDELLPRGCRRASS